MHVFTSLNHEETFEGLLMHVLTSLNHEETHLAKSEKNGQFLCCQLFLKEIKRLEIFTFFTIQGMRNKVQTTDFSPSNNKVQPVNLS